MIVYCSCKTCVWNEDGMCKGPEQPAGHTALYIIETVGGQMVCSDMKEKEEAPEE